MTTDIIEINNFVVLIEQSFAPSTQIEYCDLDDQVIGMSFYGSGEVEVTVRYDERSNVLRNSTGMAISFFGNSNVKFEHNISPEKPLKTISIFSSIQNIRKLPEYEFEIFNNLFNNLVNPADDFVIGPYCLLTAEMQNAIVKIFNTRYEGAVRQMFLKSQVTELLSHFFAALSVSNIETLKKDDQQKLIIAKEIIINNLNNPPSLSELSKMVGLNNTKLKKNFKKLFGIPVFKYLQNERLAKANELIQNSDMNIREIAWFVGYESLSSFSNAFVNKFGYRPSELKK